jgi:hypothetical protein
MGVMEFVSRLTRGQAAILGAVGGYAVGIIGGPVMKLLVYVLMFVAFIFVSRSLEYKFEQQWGLAGVVFAVIAFNSLGGVQRWLSNTLGGTFQQIPTLALAIFGAYIAVKVHEVGLLDEDEDSNFS